MALGVPSLTHGTPSQDILLRVLAAMEPGPFRKAFLTWAHEVMQSAGVCGQIAVDGQTHRGSSDPTAGQKPVQMLSALACESRLSLGQQRTDPKSNEITALPEMLQLLYFKGVLVSIDLMIFQTKIAKNTLDKAGDYLFGLEGNQSIATWPASWSCQERLWTRLLKTILEVARHWSQDQPHHSGQTLPRTVSPRGPAVC